MESTRTTVLVLHGYSQNASIFSKRLAALRRECGDHVEFVFAQAPHVMHPVDLPGLSLASFAASEAAHANTDPTMKPREWWKLDKDRTSGTQLTESIMTIREMLRSRQFDGVFGFSQGAAFAAIISSLLEKPYLYSPFLVDGKPPHPPFKFCIAISGFRLREPLCNKLFANQCSTPTLHVIGRNDIVVIEEKSRQLVEVSCNRRVELHDGGHFMPSKRQWLRFFHDYMMNPSAYHPSPAPSGTSTPLETTYGHARMMGRL